MRAVRCDACGAKALMAAAKCPKCGHLFEVRDGFGEMLPLAYCSSCESYYPEHLGSCRWCGTKPERAPIGPYIWKAVGGVAFAAMVITAFVLRDSGKKISADDGARASLGTDTPASTADTAASRLAMAPADTATASPAAIEGVRPTTPGRTTMASSGSIARDSASPPSTAVQSPPEHDRAIVQAAPEPVAPPTAARPAPTRAAPKSRPLAKSSTRLASPPSSRARKSSSRWVSSISKHWVLVRADASRASRVVASIGPNTRVQLGETRGEWRRIRARGLSGWVEHAAFFAVAGASGRPRGLATR